MALKIVSLLIENFKKIRAVEITPAGSTVTISGKNRQGKSSILDGIMVAFAGTKHMPEKPIRDGAEKALIQIDCGEFTLERRISKSGTTLKIESKDGVIKSPQAFLDKIIGEISFDPLEFIRREPKQQRALLMNLTGANTDAMDAELKKLRDIDRPAAGREVDRAKVQRDSATFTPDLPAEEIDPDFITGRINEAAALNKVAADVKGKIDRVDQWVKDNAGRVEELQAVVTETKAEMARISKLLYAAEEKVRENDANMKRAAEHREQLLKDPALSSTVDTAPLMAELAGLSAKNKLIAANKQHTAAAFNFKAREKEYAGLTRKIEDLESKKTALLTAAKMPVDGLAFGDDCLLYNRIPLAQVSDSEKIKIGIAIAMKLNPTLRVIRITDGSLLDADTMAEINGMVDAEGYQLWIEKVCDGTGVGIIIEDGSIKE
jgi:hypothetical protein